MIKKLILIAFLATVAQAKEITYNVSAYCSCSYCCGKNACGITASGKSVRWGYVAADKKLFKFGTKLSIEGFTGHFTVEDTGSAIKGRKLDIWFPSHQEAKEFGRKNLKVKFVK